MARSVRLLVASVAIAISGRYALCQTGYIVPSTAAPVANTPPAQMPAYEVATIKPAAANGYALPLRVYIQAAFGLHPNSVGWVIGPDWINSARYVIHGKPPDSIEKAMQSMTVGEKRQQVELMMQSLLADRFKLKAHFETREMPVYELTVAKGGTKLKENTDPNQGQFVIGSSSARGIGVPMRVFCDLLGSVADIGGRAVIDKTGLSGAYDFSLKWTPMDAVASSGGLSGTAGLTNADGASLFTAMEEQLGLKLVSAKAAEQVLVIDHIERPSEN